MANAGFVKESRWITVRTGANGNAKFRHAGRTYRVDEFIRCRDNPWHADMNVPEQIHAYHQESFSNLFLEVHPSGDMVRLWREKTREE